MGFWGSRVKQQSRENPQHRHAACTWGLPSLTPAARKREVSCPRGCKSCRRISSARELPAFYLHLGKQLTDVMELRVGRKMRDHYYLSQQRRCISRTRIQLRVVCLCGYKEYPLSPPPIVQELRESRGGRPGLSVLTSLLVSVDVKIY